MITMVKGHTTGGERIRLIPCRDIRPNPSRPRRSFSDEAMVALADSIHRHGVLVPLTVVPDGDGFMLISGERRLRAAALLCMSEVPCIVLPADERLCAEYALIESLQKQELNIFEQAEAIERLISALGMTRDEAARQLSCSASCIANRLRLLRLDADERELVLRHGLGERHVRAALRLPDAALRKKALAEIAVKGMTVAAAEEYIEALVGNIVESQSFVPRREAGQGAAGGGAGGAGAGSVGSRTLARGLIPVMNTVNRTVRSLAAIGVRAEIIRRDGEGFSEITIRLPTK